MTPTFFPPPDRFLDIAPYLVALVYLPALRLPLIASLTRSPVAWNFLAAATGLALAPAFWMMHAERLSGGAAYSDPAPILSRAPYEAALALTFATLGFVQLARTRLDREDRRATSLLFRALLCAVLGWRRAGSVIVPNVAPARDVDFPTALRPWERLLDVLALAFTASLAALAALRVPLPLWRCATGRPR